MHFNFDNPIALAGFTAPAFHVETEPAGLIAAGFCLRQSCEPIADGREGTRIRGGVLARRPADRTLVDIDHLIKKFETFDRFTGGWCLFGPVQTHRGRFEQGFDCKRGFTTA